MNEEIWKEIDDLQGRYEVSNCGQVRNNQGIILKSVLTPKGYKQYIIKVNGQPKTFIEHRMVAKAFLENIENKPCVNHKNGIKTDNKVENLEWVTYSENTTHAFSNGLCKPIHKYTPVHCLDLGLSTVTVDEMVSKLVNRGYKISKLGIYNCLKGARRSTAGLKFSYGKLTHSLNDMNSQKVIGLLTSILSNDSLDKSLLDGIIFVRDSIIPSIVDNEVLSST